MIPTDFREPRKITDLAEYANEYIEFMRATPTNSVCDALVEYAHDFFRDVPVDQRQMRALGMMVVDRMYRQAAELMLKDGSVRLYYATVIRYVLDLLAYRGVRVFYILDNEIRFDRFHLALELFIAGGASVVTPYTEAAGPLNFEEVQRSLTIELAAGRHVAYVEMDDTVNHLAAVVDFAKATDRLVILRNQAPSDPNVQHIPSRGVAAGDL